MEGRQEVLAQVALADRRGIAVVATLGNAVGGEVLERRDDAPLEAVVARACAAHHGGGHLRGEEDILAVGLLDARPAGLARQVDHRAVADVSALRPQFRGDGAADPLDRPRVPGRGQPDARRVDRRADGHVAVGALLGQQNRNAQPAVLDGIALQLVAGPGGQPRIESRLEGLLRPRVGPEGRPQHAAVLPVDKFAVAVRDDDLAPGALFVHGPPQRAEQLPDLLLEGHLGEQRFGALLRRERRIPVIGRRTCRGTEGRACQYPVSGFHSFNRIRVVCCSRALPPA